ncbi:MAG: hypothetical protein OXL41_12975 [Nitrospinae bacterium]|nr:hypothetical protein [Nitrospinota bacterium]
MRKTILAAMIFGLCLTSGIGAGAEKARAMDDAVSKHMVAQAKLAAHFIAAAVKAGMSKKEIDAVLTKVAKESTISEFWISDEKGKIEFTNIPGTSFQFPADVSAKSQAAPFAALLSGAKKVVVQGFQPRELDGKPFKYVGVAGVDKPRIVQVGVAGGK